MPVDLRATLGVLRHGGGDPTTRFAPNGCWRATRTPDGPGTQRIWRPSSDPHVVECEAWGPGAGWLCSHVGDLVGVHDEVSGFDPSAHPVVARAAAARPGMRVGRSLAVLEVVVPHIVGQRVASDWARRSWQAMTRRFGDPAPGPPGLVLPVEPSVLASLPYYELHRFNIERTRAETIRRAAAASARLERLAREPRADADAVLRSVPGIGPWTAAWTRLAALGDPDAVPVGDYGIPTLVAWTLEGESGADDTRMLELLEPFAGHRGRVVRLLKSVGSKPPRRGPRLVQADLDGW